MKIISCSFNHILYMLLYSISSLNPRILFMFVESVSLLFIVIFEDISLFLNQGKKKSVEKINKVKACFSLAK